MTNRQTITERAIALILNELHKKGQYLTFDDGVYCIVDVESNTYTTAHVSLEDVQQHVIERSKTEG